MTGINRSFILNTVAAIFYNGLAGCLIVLNARYAFSYTAGLFLIAGIHLIYLFYSSLKKIRKFKPVGFTGFTILAVFFIHIIFWLLFIKLP